MWGIQPAYAKTHEMFFTNARNDGSDKPTNEMLREQRCLPQPGATRHQRVPATDNRC